jgi:hypothetical protein
MKDLPSILFGTLAVIAGLLALGLPETGNTVLLQTVDDAELMMRDSLLSSCW